VSSSSSSSSSSSCVVARRRPHRVAGWGDGAAALSAVGGIALYYGALYLLRERLEKKIHFKIHKQ